MLQKLFLATLVVGFTSGKTLGQQVPLGIQFSNPTTLPTPRGYSQLVEIDLGATRMIIISGQVALDSTGNIVGKDDPKRQFEQIFHNLRAAVESVHGTMNNVVKLTYYLRDVAHLPIVREVRDKYINVQQPPTSTAVEVSNLFRSDCLGEIEATVIIPKSK